MNELTSAFLITSLTYLVTGAAPPVVAFYVLNIRFLGGIWAALLVGVIGAVIGGLLASLIEWMPDMVIIANSVDVVPPLVLAVILTALYGVISRSNAT